MLWTVCRSLVVRAIEVSAPREERTFRYGMEEGYNARESITPLVSVLSVIIHLLIFVRSLFSGALSKAVTPYVEGLVVAVALYALVMSIRKSVEIRSMVAL